MRLRKHRRKTFSMPIEKFLEEFVPVCVYGCDEDAKWFLIWGDENSSSSLKKYACTKHTKERYGQIGSYTKAIPLSDVATVEWEGTSNG